MQRFLFNFKSTYLCVQVVRYKSINDHLHSGDREDEDAFAKGKKKYFYLII